MPKGWDGLVSRKINRRLSRPIARFLAEHTNLTPNQVSVLSFVVGVFSGVSFLLNQPILGGLLAQFASILDGVDGDLAVITGRTSAFGGFLDSILDRYCDLSIILGMAYPFLLTFGENLYPLLITFAALFGSLMVSYSRAKAEKDLGIIFRSGFSGYAANRDVRLFIIMVGGVLNQIPATLTVLAVLTNLTVAKRVYDVRRASER
ncbi:CDP-alcohol phosphatidyltransferase family protein [Candidatus Bathyarchaeota archaeon]|nr:CDP-alcohol phosphatidyltransferase family protein [Candidatus Bathyarchaeota archaeon]